MVRELDANDIRTHLTALAAVLVDCVEGGASVSFLPPFSMAEGEAFFAKIADGVEKSERVLLAAFDGDQLVGTVQLIISMPPNQPHRGDVAKLLVSSKYRSKGWGRHLMEQLEHKAAALGKSLLVLDTYSESIAERLYVKLGWTKIGEIPDYAILDGKLAPTSIFFKRVGQDGC